MFAGYGVTDKDINYDDYKSVDVTDKIVLLIRKTPRFENKDAPFDKRSSTYYAGLNTKATNAAEHHAAAVIIVNDHGTAEAGDSLMEFGYTSQDSQSKLPALQLRRAVVDAIFQSCLGTPLLDVEQDIDRDLRPRSAVLAGWTVDLEVHVDRPGIPVKNIVGVLEGSGPLAQQTVVVGAHYDHLGYGGFGSLSRNAKERGGAIHHGADDNGSGTTTLIELARRFGRIPNRQGRRLVFIAFTGEESGLFGSAHYCKEPSFPLADTVAMLNLDMVGRLRPDQESHKDKLIVYGTGSATGFDTLLESANKKSDFKLQKIASGMGPSDQQSFYLKNIPVLFFFTGDHPDYHRPSDTADKINVTGMLRVADFIEDLIASLEDVPERPKYVRVPNSRGRGGMRMGGPRLGIMPEYGDDGEGVLLSGVVEGGSRGQSGSEGRGPDRGNGRQTGEKPGGLHGVDGRAKERRCPGSRRSARRQKGNGQDHAGVIFRCLAAVRRTGRFCEPPLNRTLLFLLRVLPLHELFGLVVLMGCLQLAHGHHAARDLEPKAEQVALRWPIIAFLLDFADAAEEHAILADAIVGIDLDHVVAALEIGLQRIAFHVKGDRVVAGSTLPGTDRLFFPCLFSSAPGIEPTSKNNIASARVIVRTILRSPYE